NVGRGGGPAARQATAVPTQTLVFGSPLRRWAWAPVPRARSARAAPARAGPTRSTHLPPPAPRVPAQILRRVPTHRPGPARGRSPQPEISRRGLLARVR